MPALAMHTTMMKPEELREFQADFKTVKNSRASAILYLDHEAAHIASGAGMKKTWRAAVDCGKALKRMHDNESWRDSYPSWIALLRVVPISKSYAHRLMSCAEILDTIPKASIGKIQTPLSIRNIEALGEATPEQQQETLEQAAKIGKDPAFAALVEVLDDMPQGGEIKQGEAPKKEAGVAWVKRIVTSLKKWFETRGMAEEMEGVFSELNRHVSTAEAAELAGAAPK